ncbi:hypothetical protein MNBD_CHLOROFLEXI01-2741 [hydrothermal vent metagenome]|uniref:Uncharacterized protein n=1 Tax=hydrothermal vent metagenome TaxID=652676 RepID=A0A3B0UTN6_9ZZZZ
MVHALKQIQGLLGGNGRLIDIHPIGEPAPIHVRLDKERHLVGWVQETSDYIKYGQADDALSEAAQRGWFSQEQRQLITFSTYAQDLAALREHLHENWKEAWIEELVAMQIESMLNSITQDKEIIVQEKIWMSRYRPIFARPSLS